MVHLQMQRWSQFVEPHVAAEHNVQDQQGPRPLSINTYMWLFLPINHITKGVLATSEKVF